MNRAQKNAWFGLVNCSLAIIFYVELFLGRIFFYIPKPGLKEAPQPSLAKIIFEAILGFWPFILPVIALILLLMPRKKQSPAEPNFDELDTVIQNKATQIAFISVWILWPLALVITMLKYGITEIGMTGSLPILFFFYIHLGIFLVCMTIYFTTKVLLYRKQTQRMANG